MITENICELVSKSRAVFTELGYSKGYIDSMLSIARAIVRRHKEQGEAGFKSDIINSHVKQQEKRHQNGEINRGMFIRHKTVTRYLTQIYNTGSIIHNRHNSPFELPDCFERILSEMSANESWSPVFRKKQCNRTSLFFRWLHSNGHSDLNFVDEHVVREYLIDCSSRMVGGSLDNTRRAVKELFIFISEDGALPESMSKLFLLGIRRDEKIKPFMPQDEIAAVLNVIDRGTTRGKRDYAIILLAAVTGLRACDIVELSLDSVDWRNGEIRIIQEKTEKALALPLTTDVGEAVREYILNGRPRGRSNKVFLNARAPFGGMHPSTPIVNLKNYCAKAGVTARGLHSLRRCLATNMVTSGVSVITVAQTLGHTTIDSTKQYISLDSQNLRECALDFSGIPIGGGKL